MKLVKAKYSLKAKNNDELTFEKGDVITVTQTPDGGWWEGTLQGKTGWFPSNYVTECKGDEKAGPAAQQNQLLIDQSTKDQHHILVVKHLQESEAEYVLQLDELIQKYLQPISSSQLLTTDEFSLLTGNINEIYSFQKNLLKSISECAKLAVSQQKIGGLFLCKATSFQSIYTAYASNHPSTVPLLQQYRESLDEFMNKKSISNSGVKTLTHHLALPFRRLEKYPSLLKELEIHVDESHIDRGDTQRSLSVYRDIQILVIETRKDKEMELDIINSEISDWEGDSICLLGDLKLSAHVKIVNELELQSQGDKEKIHTNSGVNDRVMFLFSSCIVLLSVNESLRYHYEGKLLLSTIKMKKLEDSDNYSNVLEFTGSMIDKMVVSFPSFKKRNNWYDAILSLLSPSPAAPIVTSKSETSIEHTITVHAATLPHKSQSTPITQVQSKAQLKMIHSSAKTARFIEPTSVIDSYNQINAKHNKGINGNAWTFSCLRPLPPARPTLTPREDNRSPKLQRKASTLGRRKNNVEDTKILQEDAKILQIIEAYCTSVRSRHTVNSSILDNPNMLIAEDEKIICEVTKDNETVIEEKSLVDTVYVIKDQLKELQKEIGKLRRDLDEEKKSRKKLESIVHKSLPNSRKPSTTIANNHSPTTNTFTTVTSKSYSPETKPSTAADVSS